MDALASTLSVPAALFDPLRDSSLLAMGKVAASSLEAIQYVPSNGTPQQAARSLSCDEHVDRGLLSFILADTCRGLQVPLSIPTMRNSL